ncbi:hypothetical protein CBER1_00469 [Cercospora berteroae]|uniref:Oxo-4-hydroxy-4-carboxy-5-ureidoimidazoline decarboxylase domain-containing protein n=1 Tax=Cercospora berteroae TaxID=357750 RepID=A0A2S6CBI6_9PEZI|nr:hypothetical protein CBER1_00469 [Cercospora berteroae]
METLCNKRNTSDMGLSKLPPVADIPTLSTADRAAILDLLFEPSTQLHTLSIPLLHEKPFESYADLISSIGVQLTDLAESASTSDTAWLESILGSHPRLGAKKVESAQSQAEQAQLQGNTDETEQLRLLNEEYEKTYPGLRYVVFVNGRSRSVIMHDMRERIANSKLPAERLANIRAMCEIAADRANKNSNSGGDGKKQGKKPAKPASGSGVSGGQKKQEPKNLTRLLEETGVKSNSKKGKEGFKAGAKYGASEFVDVSLDDPVQEPEDPDYEMIDSNDTSYDGEQHRSYNGQPDHARKYPKGFGKEGERK